MRLVVVGRAAEVAGFALAGVETAVCATAGEVEAVVSELAAHGTGLIFVSPWADRHASRVIEDVRHRKGPPVIVTLPDGGVESA